MHNQCVSWSHRTSGSDGRDAAAWLHWISGTYMHANRRDAAGCTGHFIVSDSGMQPLDIW